MPNKNIKIRYIKSHDYKVSLVTGVFGGTGTNGLINLNFCVDRMVIPDSETVEVDENGKKIRDVEREKDGDAVKEVLFGTLIDLNTAKFISNFLDKQIKELEKLSKK